MLQSLCPDVSGRKETNAEALSNLFASNCLLSVRENSLRVSPPITIESIFICWHPESNTSSFDSIGWQYFVHIQSESVERISEFGGIALAVLVKIVVSIFRLAVCMTSRTGIVRLLPSC